MDLYLNCPNGCSGEVPLSLETTDDGAADMYGPTSYLVAFVDDDANAGSHAAGCPPLTEAQREKLEQRGGEIANEPGFWPDD